VCEFLGLEFEQGMIEYGKHSTATKGLGDPVTVNRQIRPVTDSVDRWAEDLADDPAKLAIVRGMIEGIDDADLEAWGFPRTTFFDPVQRAIQRTGRRPPKSPPLDRFILERKVLRALRGTVHKHRSLEGLIRKVRLLCDVLLRGG